MGVNAIGLSGFIITMSSGKVTNVLKLFYPQFLRCYLLVFYSYGLDDCFLGTSLAVEETTAIPLGALCNEVEHVALSAIPVTVLISPNGKSLNSKSLCSCGMSTLCLNHKRLLSFLLALMATMQGAGVRNLIQTTTTTTTMKSPASLSSSFSYQSLSISPISIYQ